MYKGKYFDLRSASGLPECAIAIMFFGLVFQIEYSCISKLFFRMPVNFLMPAYGRFDDFYNWGRFLHNHDVTTFAFIPPTSTLFMNCWAWFADQTSPNFALAVYIPLWLLSLIYAVYKLMNADDAFSWKSLIYSSSIVVLSYGTLFCVDRGNVAGYVIAALGLGIHYYRQDKFNRSIFFIAVAANMKIAPLMFVALPLLDGRWKLTFKYILVSAAMFIVSLLLQKVLFDYTYSFMHFISGLSLYYDHYAILDGGFSYGTSLFGGMKTILHLVDSTDNYPADVKYYAPLYNMFSSVMLAATGLLLWIKKPTFSQITVLLICCMMLFPPVLSDYYLGLLLLPLALCIREALHAKYVVLIALSQIPKEFADYVNFYPGNLATPIIISAVFLMCVWDVLHCPHRKILGLFRSSPVPAQ